MSEGSVAPVGDPFEREYAAPMLEVPGPDVREREREEREGEALAVPWEPYALRGCVLTPDRVVDDGWVVVGEGRVVEVSDRRPVGLRTIDTGGVVLPGLIDLHGHPEYNVFAAWEPPREYANRYQWRRSREYAAVIKAPWRTLTQTTDEQPSLLRTLTRYAEARAMVGGVTALQGASGRYPDPHESLVRNVDRYILGQQPGRSMVDLDRARPEELARTRQRIDDGQIRALYVHLAEGTDEASRREFEQLIEVGLLTGATVIIHGTALTDRQLGDVKDAGAKLVWSPQSNLRLYGQTTAVARALRLGIPVGLGADWLPSGSPSLLEEIQVARRILNQQGSRVGAKRLVGMVTSQAARIAGLYPQLGTLRPGTPADLLVLQRHHADPWESVVSSDRRSVELVTIGGDVTYGRIAWVDALAGPTEREPVTAWGKPMALDLTYSVMASPEEPPRLANLRSQLLARYPQTGPIFA
ncbi:MAG TPA: amidohydrolase family protein [Nitriliruptorales bacterium]|nr:amidohydrolase family protein [Nitriliruptorales bacterium]